jgi:hypothetical protein
MITSKNKVIDLGDVVRGSTISHTFELKNEYSKPIYVTKAVASCGCTKPFIQVGFIKPQESVSLQFMFNTQGKGLGDTVKSITLHYTINNEPSTFVQKFKAKLI